MKPTVRTIAEWPTVPAMTPRVRLMVATAAVLSASFALTACGGPSTPSPGASGTPTAAGSTPGIDATPPASTPASTAGGGGGGGGAATLTGTGFFLGTGAANGGLYTLHNGTLTQVINDTSYEFFSTATVSTDGQKVAWIGADSHLRVQTIGGAAATSVGPAIVAARIPQFSPNPNDVVVATDTTHLGLLHLDSGTVSAWATPMAGYYFGVCAPDLSDCVQSQGATIKTADPLTPTSPITAVAPAGQYYYRVQSVLGYFDDYAVVMLKPNGTPAGDAGRVTGANALVNMRTGEILATPGGGDVTGGFYLTDQTVILRETVGGVDTVVNAGPNGHVVGTTTVPASAANLALIGWTL